VARGRFELRLYAHRGASAELPENTLAGFRRALELGADAIESDVHLTRDGHVVLSHDESGARCCGVAREIRRATLAEVKSWDAGWGFTDREGGRPFAGAGHRVPTLDEVLDELPGVPLNLDVKQERPSMVGALVEVLRRRRAEERVTLASFHMWPMLRARLLGYRGATSLPEAEIVTLLRAPAALFAVLPWRGSAAQVPLAGGGYRFDTAEFVGRCHRLGLRLDFWTVNDAPTAERLLELGADGVMTDDPRAIAPVFARSRGGQAAGQRV
jgi:glycerophosphoryl diester phosphodiesterase